MAALGPYSTKQGQTLGPMGYQSPQAHASQIPPCSQAVHTENNEVIIYISLVFILRIRIKKDIFKNLVHKFVFVIGSLAEEIQLLSLRREYKPMQPVYPGTLISHPPVEFRYMVS